MLTALEFGYTHIDTASAYENEEDIGQAIEESGVERTKLFLTSKVWYQKLRYKDVIDQCNSSLDKLRTDYLDLLLIHWPNKFIPFSETFEAFERLVEDRKVRSVGVSNFTVHHLQDAIKATALPLSVNQVEVHPLFYQHELITFCKEHKIVVTAYSPLAHGKILKSDILKEISYKKEAEPGQIALAWLIQKNIVVIPKASSEEHIRANIEALSVELTNEEMSLIDKLPEQKRTSDPMWAEFDY